MTRARARSNDAPGGADASASATVRHRPVAPWPRRPLLPSAPCPSSPPSSALARASCRRRRDCPLVLPFWDSRGNSILLVLAQWSGFPAWPITAGPAGSCTMPRPRSLATRRTTAAPAAPRAAETHPPRSGREAPQPGGGPGGRDSDDQTRVQPLSVARFAANPTKFVATSTIFAIETPAHWLECPQKGAAHAIGTRGWHPRYALRREPGSFDWDRIPPNQS